MGLDMYLTVNSKKVAEAAHYNGFYEFDEWHRSAGIAAYWRKANAIHNWFVDNVQYGDDDCKIYEVSVEQLAELKTVCDEVLSDHSKAEELLPTTQGFFFGSTEYDEYYFEDLEFTSKSIGAILNVLVPDSDRGWWYVHKDEPDWYVQFTYHSSW